MMNRVPVAVNESVARSNRGLDTRDAGPFLMEEAIAAGVDEILGKPLDLRELGAA